MSWLFNSGTNVQFDELVDKATSELLPLDDESVLLTSLQLSDVIRSKGVEPAAALKSLRRRLSHKNFNVQILALNVCDILVKNSGEAFNLQVANGKEGWMAQLEELCRSSNAEVRTAALTNVQNWAIAFGSTTTSSALSSSDLTHLYNRLRYSLTFPPVSNALTSSMISSLSAPEWVDSDLCQRCRTPFTVTNRKHHCRNCGGVFCGACSSKNRKLEHLGIEQEVRVCDGCHKKLSTPGGIGRSPSISKSIASSIKGPTPAAKPAGGKTQEEIDFERAIAMSLAESGSSAPRASEPSYAGSSSLPGVGYGYEARPSQPSQTFAPPQAVGEVLAPTKQMEAEDPDLAAAIRASLAESEAEKKRQQGSYASTHASATAPYVPFASSASVPYEASAPSQPYSYTPQPASAMPSVPSHDLLLSEFDALDSFASALSPHSHAVQQGTVKIDDANELFYGADRHRTKMLRALQDADTKTEILAELNQKLQRAVRVYDQLLERGIGAREAGRYGYQPQQPYRGYAQQNPIPQGQPQQHQQYQQAYQQQALQQQSYQQQQHYQPQSQAQQYHRSIPQSSHIAAPQPESQPYTQSHQHQQAYASSSTQMPTPHYEYEQPQDLRQAASHQAQSAHEAAQHQPYRQASQQSSQYAHSHDSQMQHQDDSQYYNSTPQGQASDSHEAVSSAPYPASAYPYEQVQSSYTAEQNSLGPASYQEDGYAVDVPNRHQANPDPVYEAAESQNGQNGHVPAPAHHQHDHQREHVTEQAGPPQYAEAPGRFQGYYKPSSFPSVPDNPVGEMGLPSAPNGELPAFKQRHGQENAATRQEEALIEF